MCLIFIKSPQIVCCHSVFHSSEINKAHQWVILHQRMTWLYSMTVSRIQMSEEKQTGFISTCVCVSWLQVCQGHTTGCKAFCCLQTFHTPASSDSRASKHGGEVLLSLDGTRACLCLCMSFSTIPWEPWRWPVTTWARSQQSSTSVGMFRVYAVGPHVQTCHNPHSDISRSSLDMGKCVLCNTHHKHLSAFKFI